MANGSVTAEDFVRDLRRHQSDEELRKIRRYFKEGSGDDFIGVRMQQVFALAKDSVDMSPAEISRLLDSPVHEARAGALSIMSKQAVRKSTSAARRKELYELYLSRHDRIDNWDLVDLAAPNVVGGYLLDKPRDVLFELARSADPWRRRTAIFSTLAFVRHGEVDDTIAIATFCSTTRTTWCANPPAGCCAKPARRTAPRCSHFWMPTRHDCPG